MTFSARRRRGSSVVAFSCSGIISPRPLKRMTSGFTFFGSFAKIGVALALVERPVRLLPRVDPVERRLGEVDVPFEDRASGGAARRR